VRPGLNAWLRDHVRTAGDTLHFISSRLGTSLLVWLLVGIALALPAGLFLLQQNLSRMTDGWEGRPGITAYFELDAAATAVSATRDWLEADESVSGVAVTTPDAALAEFRSFTRLADALEMLDANPLPASLRATLAEGAGVADLERLAGMLSNRTGVREVVVEKTWLERVSDISAVVSRLGIVLGALFGLGAVLVTSTSVRLAIESRLEELRVLKLIGATERQMRRPFLYFGACYGLGGGLVAAMLLSVCLLVIEAPLTNLAGSYSAELDLAGFDPGFLLGLLLIGAGLGVIGALLAAAQRLSDLEIL
jgi:cell division transport system permease protein